MAGSPLRRRAFVPAQTLTERPDLRVARVEAEDEAEDQLRERARAALDDAECIYSNEALEAVVVELQGVVRAADTVKLKLVEVGRRLLRVQQHVGAGGYRALAARGIFPFDDATASKLRMIATRVDEGQLPAEVLPRTLKPAYLAATLPSDVVTRLVAEGRLGPSTSFRELRELYEAAKPRAKPATKGMTAKERRMLLARLENYERKARELRARLGLI